MDLTSSFNDTFPQAVLDRYVFHEIRNASTIIQATNPQPFSDIVEVLNDFYLLTSHLVLKGGQESALAGTLNRAFRDRGWREARVDTTVRLALKLIPYRPAGETEAIVADTESNSEGYKVDNFALRVALDIEWNAKDGNLDRDIAAYRSLYDAGLIDAAVIITRTLELRDFGREIGLSLGMPEAAAKKILNTTTTTNLKKLLPRVERGDSGGCPLLIIGISEATHDGFAIEDRDTAQAAMLAAASNGIIGGADAVETHWEVAAQVDEDADETP